MSDVIDMALSKRLKAETAATHDTLDQTIMARDPFRDHASYGRFLTVQYQFHCDLDPLYAEPELRALVPDLAARQRLDAIAQDLADLDLPLPAADAPPIFARGAIDRSTALGWLYVAEGSNLGAAFLYKAAARLGLDGDFGARHLAGHPDGRAQHWRQFTAVLDGLACDVQEADRVIAGARDAFVRVRALVDAAYA